jgi:hypothetical protein
MKKNLNNFLDKYIRRIIDNLKFDKETKKQIFL